MARAAGAELVVDAILLRAVTTGEADRVVTLLTRQLGKVSAVAKQALRSRKRFGAALAPFVVGRAGLLERRASELYVLERFEPVRDFTGLASDPVAFAHGSYETELARELVAPGHAEAGVLELLGELYQTLVSSAPAADTLRAFEMQLLELLGLRPVLERCLLCGKDDEATLTLPGAVVDPGSGGLRCARCAPAARGSGVRPLPDEVRVRLQTLGKLTLAEAARLSPLSPEQTARAREVTHACLAAHLPGPLHSLEFIQQLRHGQ